MTSTDAVIAIPKKKEKSKKSKKKGGGTGGADLQLEDV
jgi:hypothetical protein